MRPGLKYSVLALLSTNKFNIFNRGLIEFMRMLNNGQWNKSDRLANYGAFLIDHINQFKDIDFKNDDYLEIKNHFESLIES